MWCATSTSTHSARSPAGRSRQRAQRRLHRQIEAVLGESGRGGEHIVGVDIDDGELDADLPHIGDMLVRAVRRVREQRAQRLVPVLHVAHRQLQHPQVQRAAHPQRHRDVVDAGAAVESVEEPQPPLRLRERNPVGPQPAGQPHDARV